MSYIIITLEIIDFQPNTFDYSTFGFIFSSDQKNFEDQISVNNNIYF